MFGRSRRLGQILRTVRRFGLGELLQGRGPTWLLGRPRQHEQPIGVRIRLALESLGPVFVKFGQTVSTRRDLLPPDIADELVKLQDQVPPFSGAAAKATVAAAYGQPLEEVFAYFEAEPLAAASIAQVHVARLLPVPGESQGMEVIVKVLRPDVRKQIDRDLKLMHLLAAQVARWVPEARRLRPREVVNEYERIIFDELDLIREGANCSQLRRNWLGSDLIYHPVVLFEHTRENLLVMERIRGIPVDDIDALKAAGVNFQVLAERGVEIFFKQVFRDNFFHADMHPGNIFVDPSNPERPRYIGVDFGIVGSLNPSDQRYLAENFLAFFNHDYRRVAELHIESGWVPRDTRVDEFEGAIRSVCEPIFNKPLAEISFGVVLIRLFATARRFNMQVQPQLVLLQKTVLNVEGLGRQLYPQLDLWKTAKPVLEQWMRERMSPTATADRLKTHLPLMLETLPQLVGTVARRWESGVDPASQRTEHALAEISGQIRAGNRATRLTVAGMGFLICAVLASGTPVLTPWPAFILAGLGAACLGRAWKIPKKSSSSI